MDIKRIANTLHSFERKVLPVLEKYTELQEIVKISGLQEVEVTRALQWLQNKEAVKIETREHKVIFLTDKAKQYKELPERTILLNLKDKETTLEDLKKKTKLDDAELNACIGLLKRNLAIDITKDKTLKLKLNENGKKLLNKKTPEENLFEKLLDNKLNLNNLSDIEKFAFGELKKRGLASAEEIKDKTVTLTELGKELAKQKFDSNVIDTLTPEIIRSKEWKRKNLRGYDIKAEVPTIQRGKRHFVDQSIEYVKRIWLDLGFKELEGSVVQTSFWNLDTLFVPQDHSAREMQDTFFLGTKGAVLRGKLPEKIIDRIKSVHENGWTTGSKGWGGKWNPEIAKEVLLRTHTTVLSAIALSKLKKEDLPVKFFKVGKVYRNEALDWKHLFEFYQVEGIVVDPNANFRNLIGYLKEFYKKMGFDKIRISPSFFPYVSPALEIAVWHPEKREWVETGGAGIFRPEVTKALLGFECPVLAWGQGLERILVEYYKIKDLRQIYGNDLKMLREIKEFIK